MQRRQKNEKYYGASGNGNAAIWWSVGIGGGVLLLAVIFVFAFMIRGQQTGSQLTNVGEAKANQYKDMNLPGGLKNLVMPGNSNLNVNS